MTIAEDAHGVQILTNTGTTNTIPYTPTGTLAGVCLLFAQGNNSTDTVTSVQYGGQDMTQIESAIIQTDEPGIAYAYFLGSGVPTGSQNFVVTTSVGQARSFAAYGFTSSGGDIELVDSGTVNNDSIANPEYALNHNSRDCWVGFSLFSGRGNTTLITTRSGFTRDVSQIHSSARVTLVESYDTVGSANVTAGVDASADNAALIAVALAEAAAAEDEPLVLYTSPGLSVTQ